MSVFAMGQTIGRVPCRWGACAVMLSPVVHERRRVNEAHAHQAAFVTLMLDGEYAETAALRSIRFERFSAVYHPAGLEHRDVIGAPGVRLLMFEFDPQLLDGADVDASSTRAVRDLSATRAAWQILSLYHDALGGHDDLDFEARALGIIGDLVRFRGRLPGGLPSLARARDFMHAGFRERITMKQISDAAGIHPVYLGQMFHRRTGETIGGYVSRLRVRAAAERLCTTSQPLAAIALDHGFCDQSHFQRVFKKVAGLTPSAFRAKFAGCVAAPPQ